MNKAFISKLVLCFGIIVLLANCKGSNQSATTGWDYDNPEWGGFESAKGEDQMTPPGMVFIEGGSFVMGQTTDNVRYEWHNQPKRVTVSSFYMDECEVTNLDYREYLYWLNRVYGNDYPEVYQKALPDTLVWRSKLSYNEPMVDYYFRHSSWADYPVVGVSWLQANEYCSWRTDRVNEKILANVLLWTTLIVIFRELGVTSIRLVSSNAGGGVIPANFFGKAKTVTQIIAILVILIEYALNVGLGAKTLWIATYISVVLMVFMTVASGINYLKAYAKYFNPKE